MQSSDLPKMAKKANWHTIAVIVPGLTVILLVADRYFEMRTRAAFDVLHSKIESMEKMQAMIKDDQQRFNTQIRSMIQSAGSTCRNARKLANKPAL